MSNIYDSIIAEEKKRNILHVDDIVPFYTISVGCHVFNIVNQDKRLYTESGAVASTRLHTLFLAFPGFGKTFFQKQFLDSELYSIIKGTSIQCKFEGDMTNAGFIGQIKHLEDSSEPLVIKGLCEERNSSIIGIDEFSSVTNAFAQTHNVGFDTNLLKALDTGDVELRRGPGSRSYHTNLTLWAGVQPARFDIGSGFFRRFIFLVYLPTLADIAAHKNTEIDNVVIDQDSLSVLRQKINERVMEIYNDLRSVRFSSDFKSQIKDIALFHTDQQLFKRMSIGYWLLKSDVLERNLVIEMDDELLRLIKLQNQYRRKARTITTYEVVWNLIKNEDTVRYNNVLDVCLEFGIQNADIVRAIGLLSQHRRISRQKDIITVNRVDA